LPGKKALLSGKNKYEIVIVDATECPIERPKRRTRGRHKNVQKKFYSGKKKKHTVKEQLVVDTKTKKIVATAFTNGKTHDFKLFKKSESHVHPDTKVLADSGYQGIKGEHGNSETPKKATKKQKLTSEEKLQNHALSSQRIVVENVIGSVKKFKIVSQRYRNRRSRFGLRFNLICAIHNMECGT
jgi:DDE superfamily endonuclease